MITIYQEDEKKIIAQNIEDADFSSAPELSWIHVQNASSEILEKVSKVTGLSFEYLSSALD